jgi:hypothetical protein
VSRPPAAGGARTSAHRAARGVGARGARLLQHLPTLLLALAARGDVLRHAMDHAQRSIGFAGAADANREIADLTDRIQETVLEIADIGGAGRGQRAGDLVADDRRVLGVDEAGHVGLGRHAVAADLLRRDAEDPVEAVVEGEEVGGEVEFPMPRLREGERAGELRGRLAQLPLGPYPRRHVAHDAIEALAGTRVARPDHQFDIDVLTVLAAAQHLAALAEDAGRAGREMVLEIAVMPFAVVRVHQHRHVAPDALPGLVAEDRSDRRVHRKNHAAPIDGDDDLRGRIDDAAQARLNARTLRLRLGLPDDRRQNDRGRLEIRDEIRPIAGRPVGEPHHTGHLSALPAGEAEEMAQRRMAGGTAMRARIVRDVVRHQGPALGDHAPEQGVEIAELHAVDPALVVEPAGRLVPGDVGDRMGAQEPPVRVLVDRADETIRAAGDADEHGERALPPLRARAGLLDVFALQFGEFPVKHGAERDAVLDRGLRGDVARRESQRAGRAAHRGRQQAIRTIAGADAAGERWRVAGGAGRHVEQRRQQRRVVRMDEGGQRLGAQFVGAPAKHALPAGVHLVEMSPAVERGKEFGARVEQRRILH